MAAGVLDGAAMDDVLGAVAAAGFLALAAVPILFGASVVARALWAAWQPAELGLVDEHGGAPRLAGWIGFLMIGALALAWVMFQGTWLLAGWTAFKPMAMSFLEPMLAVGMTLVLALVSRPVARGLAAALRRLDARWRRAGRRSLMTPWRIAGATALVIAAVLYLLWRLVVRPKIGVFDLDILHAPIVGLGATAGIHLGWQRLPRARKLGGVAFGGLAVVAVGTALFAWQARPTLTLQVWGERPLAGLAIDRIFDLDTIRAGVSLAEFRPATQPGSPHPDIILITIDTVRADHTPPYGGSAEMPVLRDLGVKGVVFDWAFSPSNVTRRSIPSMVIGLAPNRVRGRVVGWALRIDPRHVLVAERLEAGGYDTAGFMCCEGFWGKEFRTGLQRGLQHLEIDPNGVALAQRARTWLDERERHPTGRPLFLWMHILEPHNWVAATGEPRNDDERRRFYDRSLQASDMMMVQVLGAFSHREPSQAPIVIVTADHGEALGDHGQPYHSTDLYDSQLHIPLVMAGPGLKPGRVSETVSLTDLTPTLLELAGFQPPKDHSIEGRSFADLATGRRLSNPESGSAFAAMIRDRSNPGGITTAIQGRWKLIDNGSSLELYDIHKDPDERSNLVVSRPPALQQLKRLLKQHVDAAAQSPFE